MDRGEQIKIKAASNGWIVTGVSSKEIMVFEKMDHLTSWLVIHFSEKEKPKEYLGNQVLAVEQ